MTRYCKRWHRRPGDYKPGDNCRECGLIRMRAYAARHPDRKKAADREFRRKNPDYWKLRRQWLDPRFEVRLYGSLAWFEAEYGNPIPLIY